jgi:hypothetical protein
MPGIDATSAREACDGFAATRARTLALVRGLDQATLDRRPAPGRWAVGEVLDHLLLAEGYVQGEMGRLIELARSGRPAVLRRSFSEIDISIAFIPRPLLSLFEGPIWFLGRFVPNSVRDLLLRNRILPAQNPSFATPRPGRPGEELRSDLAASLEQTRGLLAANADLDYGRMTLDHPLLGSNDIAGLLRFLDGHESRHQAQIREALASGLTGSERRAPRG